MGKSLRKINFIGISALSAYVIFISWRLFFFAYSNNYRVQMESISYNMLPFKTILNYIQNSKHIGYDVWIYNLAGNVAAFMPLGFLLPLAFRDLKAAKTYIVALFLIILAEALQLISRRGVFDVDDILLNMIGCIIGYGIFRIFRVMLQDRRK